MTIEATGLGFSHLPGRAPIGGPMRRAGCEIGRSDFKLVANGTISEDNRVMVRAAPDAPEVPMSGALVRVYHGRYMGIAWQGISDASGYYHATGLEVGATYIPVAIDLSGTYECVACGPVVAVLPAV